MARKKPKAKLRTYKSIIARKKRYASKRGLKKGTAAYNAYTYGSGSKYMARRRGR